MVLTVVAGYGYTKCATNICGLRLAVAADHTRRSYPLSHNTTVKFFGKPTRPSASTCVNSQNPLALHSHPSAHQIKHRSPVCPFEAFIDIAVQGGTSDSPGTQYPDRHEAGIVSCSVPAHRVSPFWVTGGDWII